MATWSPYPRFITELEAPGTVLGYDQAGADRGNIDKYEKELSSYDADVRALLEWLETSEWCSGRIGAAGICLGGHLAFRAAMNPEILATVCFYATDIHTGSLGKGKKDDSLARANESRRGVATRLGTAGSACAAGGPERDQSPAG